MINLVLRKLKSFFMKFFKYFYRSKSISIMINSIPKSGTHFADQIVSPIKQVNDFGYFIAQQPTFPHILRNENKILKMMDKIKCGEIVRSHIHFSKLVHQKILEKKILMIFIYRDPRDIAISESFYLYKMNKFHSAHKYFKKVHDPKERIVLSIKGINDNKIDFKKIGDRINPYINWKNKNLKNVLSISYEEMTNDIDSVIKTIYNFLIKNNFFRSEISEVEFLKLVKKNINPNKSHTFREGKINKWIELFDEDITKIFYENDGGSTSKLGYK